MRSPNNSASESGEAAPAERLASNWWHDPHAAGLSPRFRASTTGVYRSRSAGDICAR